MPVVTELKPEDSYDVIFVVVRYTQIESVIDTLRASRAKNIVFVGNNVRATEILFFENTGTVDLMPYITKADQCKKWFAGTVGMALIAAILAGIGILPFLDKGAAKEKLTRLVLLILWSLTCYGGGIPSKFAFPSCRKRLPIKNPASTSVLSFGEFHCLL